MNRRQDKNTNTTTLTTEEAKAEAKRAIIEAMYYITLSFVETSANYRHLAMTIRKMNEAFPMLITERLRGSKSNPFKFSDLYGRVEPGKRSKNKKRPGNTRLKFNGLKDW